MLCLKYILKTDTEIHMIYLSLSAWNYSIFFTQVLYPYLLNIPHSAGLWVRLYV